MTLVALGVFANGQALEDDSADRRGTDCADSPLPLPEPIAIGSHLPTVGDIVTLDLGANFAAICNRCRSFCLTAALTSSLQQLQSI